MRLALQLMALALSAALTTSALSAPGPAEHLSGAAAAAEAADLDELTQPDPHVMLGQLSNGVKYAIVQTEGPSETSVNFYVGAGSANETDAERGTAHFLEHMAFSGSKNFPPGALIPQFEAMGVELGRDQNAQTGLSGTTFALDLPNADDAKIDMAFRWLGDVADGLSIEPKEVERERGTILSEYRETLSATSDIAKQSGRFLLPGLLGAHREPIGTLQTINAATAASIRAFWQKWYRPEVSIVVVVSNEPPYRSLERIQHTFGDWRSPTPKPAEPDLGHVDPSRGFDVFAVTDPHAPNLVQVCHAMDKDAPMTEGVRSHLRDFVNDGWALILRERLDRLAEGANPPIASASVDRSEIYDQGSVSCVGAAVRNQDWKAALGTLETETRRMQLYGVTADETDSAKAELHARLTAVLPGGDKMTQKDRADIILDNLLHNGTIDTVEEDSRIVGKSIDLLTPQRIDEAFDRVWTRASGPLVVLVSSAPAPKAEVRAAWLAGEAARPAPPAAETHRTWAYDSFGPPGAVVARQELPDIGAVRLTFANGVKVNFKPLNNEPDKVFIRIRFGAGQQEAPPGEGFTAQMGASMLEAGGLGKNDLHDIMLHCQTHTCDVALLAGRDAFIMGGTTRVADLGVELQLITAFLTDPGFRPELNALLPTAVDSEYRQLGVDPNAVATRALSGRPATAAHPRPALADRRRADQGGGFRTRARRAAGARRAGGDRRGRHRRARHHPSACRHLGRDPAADRRRGAAARCAPRALSAARRGADQGRARRPAPTRPRC